MSISFLFLSFPFRYCTVPKECRKPSQILSSPLPPLSPFPSPKQPHSLQARITLTQSSNPSPPPPNNNPTLFLSFFSPSFISRIPFKICSANILPSLPFPFFLFSTTPPKLPFLTYILNATATTTILLLLLGHPGVTYLQQECCHCYGWTHTEMHCITSLVMGIQSNHVRVMFEQNLFKKSWLVLHSRYN